MHLVALTWMFIVVLMSAAEATSPQGSVLGALITLALYGLLPLGIVLYLMATPARRRARRRAQALADVAPADTSTTQGHRGSHAAGHRLAPEREEP